MPSIMLAWFSWSLITASSLFKIVSNRVELPTGEKIYAKVIYAEPSKYFTDDVMVELEKRAKEKFCYGLDTESKSIKSTSLVPSRIFSPH